MHSLYRMRLAQPAPSETSDWISPRPAIPPHPTASHRISNRRGHDCCVPVVAEHLTCPDVYTLCNRCVHTPHTRIHVTAGGREGDRDDKPTRITSPSVRFDSTLKPRLTVYYVCIVHSPCREVEPSARSPTSATFVRNHREWGHESARRVRTVSKYILW